MPKTVILGTARTPFGKLGGGLSSLDATDLGGTAIAAALERAEVAPEQVEHVVFGQVLQAGQGQIPSRQAQIKGGIPKEVASETVNKVCASGLRSAGIIDQAVRAGDLDVARGRRHGVDVAARPTCSSRRASASAWATPRRSTRWSHDGLTNPFTGKHMGEEADEVGDELEMTRADMDKFALRSHERAVAGDRRGPAARGDRARSRSARARATPSSRSTRRRGASRSLEASPSSRRVPQGGHPHRRQRARA